MICSLSQTLNVSPYTQEEVLITELKAGNAQAFGYLYDNYAPALFGIIRRNIEDTDIAADVLQEVFVRIHKNMNMYDPNKGRLFTWMMNIARNQSIDYLRSGAHQKNIQTQNIEQAESQVDSMNHAETNINQIGLKTLVESLPEQQASLIDMVYFQGYTQAEVSEKLQLPLGTVKTRIRMGIVTLRTIFES